MININVDLDRADLIRQFRDDRGIIPKVKVTSREEGGFIIYTFGNGEEIEVYKKETWDAKEKNNM